MGSGFIYLIIIAMWVAYFLPQWLSKYEENSGRTLERYKNAMQVVAESNPNIKTEPRPEEKKKIFLQRRLTFGSLFSLSLLSLICAGFGILDFITALIPSTALLIYLANLRKQVVASQLRARRLRALEKITNSRIPTVSTPEQMKVKSNQEHWIPFADRAEIVGVVVVPKDRKGWQPTTLPRPVYTTATKAVPSKRIIDLTTTGQQSAEQERIKALSGRDDDFFDQAMFADLPQEDKVVNE